MIGINIKHLFKRDCISDELMIFVIIRLWAENHREFILNSLVVIFIILYYLDYSNIFAYWYGYKGNICK